MEPPEEPGRRQLTEQVLAAEQDERRRIALFLHDGPVQSLSGVALMLDAVSDFIARGRDAEAQEILDKALMRTRTTIGELRDLSFNIEPVVLRDHGFGTAVRALADPWGAVAEPYATFYARGPNVFDHLWAGYNFGDSFYIAENAARWVMVAVGDPLYTPAAFAKK